MVVFCSVAIDDTIFRAGLTFNGNGLAFEVYVTLSIAGVGTGRNEDHVTVVGVVDSGLNRAEIARAVVTDGDHPCCTRNWQKQTD